jgi:protein-disulfide isomerase
MAQLPPVSTQDGGSSRRSTSSPRNVLIGVVVAAVLVAAAVVLAVLLNRDTEDTSAGDDSPPAATSEGGFRVGGEAVSGVEPVEVVVYDDYLCAQCAEDEAQIGGYLTEQAALGVIELEYRLVAMPGDSEVEQSYAQRAAAAAACVAEDAGVDGFLVYRRALYLNRETLVDKGYEDTDLADLARNEDFDGANDCIESDAYESWVTTNTETATAAAVEAGSVVLVEGQAADPGEDGTLQLQDMLAAVSAARAEVQ